MGLTILMINGSPHREGNTARAVSHAAEICRARGHASFLVELADARIRPCEGCFACRDGECIYHDDMDGICEMMLQSDGMILASPVYMGMVTAQMKTVMDRSVRLRVGGRFSLSGKVGGGIACGGFRNGGQELTLQCIHTFLLQQDMLVVADGPPFSHSGAAIVGSAGADEVGLRTVENLVDRLLQALDRQRR